MHVHTDFQKRTRFIYDFKIVYKSHYLISFRIFLNNPFRLRNCIGSIYPPFLNQSRHTHMYNTRTTLATEHDLLIVLIRKVCVLLKKNVKIMRRLCASISTCLVLNLPLKVILEVRIDVNFAVLSITGAVTMDISIVCFPMDIH